MPFHWMRAVEGLLRIVKIKCMKVLDLDAPLIEFNSSFGTIPWTVRASFEGAHVFGGVGSGKTSSVGKLISLKYIQAGWGGLVLTSKNDERDNWVEYARATNREKDLIILESDGHHRFNFLDYLAGQSNGRALTENMVDVLKTVIKASQDKSSGKSNDEFWTNAIDQVLNFSIELSKMAYGSVTVEILYEIIQSLPKANARISPEDGQSPSAFFKAFSIVRERLKKEITAWERTLGIEELRTLKQDRSYDRQLLKAIPDARSFGYIDTFFIETFRNLSDKTRSIIDFSISGFFFRLLQEPVFSLFCDGVSTIKPELSAEGKIILVNLPTKEFSKVGRDCQILFKYIWQKTMQGRKITNTTAPVFLFIDENQEFLHEHDADFQATSRSSRIANVFLSQNLNNYFAVMGGDKPEFRVKSFLGTIGTKFFLANADIETNTYSSSIIGDVYKETISESTAISGDSFTQTTTKQVALERAIRPEEFASLNTGGERNRYLVQAIMHRQGDKLANGKNYLKVTFDQNYRPTHNL